MARTSNGIRFRNSEKSSRELDGLYDRGYFHGTTSGYPASGYRESHPQWTPWLDLIGTIKPSGMLIDLGCAYGYLVEESRQRNYQAIGLDISSHALAQEPELAPWLGRANLEHLPLRSQSADVVTLFDVLEHLHNPKQALAEAVRILKPDGLLVGATPDPIYFEGDEETHFTERPPSFWIQAIEELGLAVHFRFSVEPHNFQFLATSRENPDSDQLAFFQHDYHELGSDFIHCGGLARALPRFGWGPLIDGKRVLKEGRAAIYLLNSSSSPQKIKLRLKVSHSPDFAQLRISFNSLVLAELPLTSELCEHDVELPEFFLPEGGHHVFFDIAPATPTVFLSDLRIESEPTTSRALTLTMPFDLFQRYQLAGDICEVLSPKTVLDIGGYMGDRDGLLAVSADFLRGSDGDRTVLSTDIRQADHPNHVPGLAGEQPFPDADFDMVVSLDVLEHLRPEERTLFLSELTRLAKNWIILGAPTSSPQVTYVEKKLAKTVMKGQTFLEEHLEYGLPKTEEVEQFFARIPGCQILRLPNGYLPRWTIMQVLTQHYFSYRDSEVSQSLNRFYNRNWYSHDQADPCYRTFWVVSKSAMGKAEVAAIEGLVSSGQSPLDSAANGVFADGDWFDLHDKILTQRHRGDRTQDDLRFLINERQKLIGLLQQETEALKNRIAALEETPLWKLALRRFKKRL